MNQLNARAERLRVLFLGKDAALGGAQRVLLTLLKHLDPQQIEPRVLLLRGGVLLDAYERAATVRLVPETPPGRFERQLTEPSHWLRVPGSVRQLFRTKSANRQLAVQQRWALEQAREFRPHVVVRTALAGPPIFHPVAQLGVPIVQHVFARGAVTAISFEAHMPRILASSTHFVCEGVGSAEDLHRCWGVPLSKISLVRNGLDLTERDRALAQVSQLTRADLKLDADSMIMVTIGQLYYIKGTDLWIAAAAALKRRRPELNFKFVWIGGRTHQQASPYAKSIAQLIIEYELRDKVLMVGEADSVYPYLMQCDIYVQPSRDDAFPQATLEAMALGKPVVTYPQGIALEQYAQDIVVRVNEVTPEALAAGIEYLIDHPDERKRRGTDSARLISQKFDARQTILDYQKVLCESAVRATD